MYIIFTELTKRARCGSQISTGNWRDREGCENEGKLSDGKVYFIFKVFLISMIYDLEPSRSVMEFSAILCFSLLSARRKI